MTLGFHSHNNLQMSYSNAIEMLKFPTNRDLMLDCSIMGMGKGAGNLNTELLLEHLNLYYGKNYHIAPLLEVIDKVINQLHSEFYWGYAPEYYLSAANQCTPSYASHFYNKHMLPIDQVGEMLEMIAPEKKISFDKNYAEEVYRQYNESKSVDDTLVIEELTKAFAGKRILLMGSVSASFLLMFFANIVGSSTASAKALTYLGRHTLFLMSFDYFSDFISVRVLQIFRVHNWLFSFCGKVLVLVIGLQLLQLAIKVIPNESAKKFLSKY